MKRMLMALLATMAAILPAASLAQSGDGARLLAGTSVIGQQSALELTVVTAKDATVEVDPAAASWNGVEVVRIDSTTTTSTGDRTTHLIRVAVAPFTPGNLQFAAAVNVISGASVEARVLPPVRLSVLSTLPADAPLELSPIAAPEAIGGAESPLLKPAIGLGAAAGLVLIAAATAWLARVVRRRLAARRPPPEEAPASPPGIEGAEGLLHHDPVAAYRSLASTIRAAIGERYGFPAFALTTAELQRRMEGHGVERWQARLVSGLLEECDAVVYAGYRPAAERREHDLTMAREILAGVA
ncbi:MAG: hypothetical protein IT302_07875 [Dehalococcoidia bacterium]|nr:hypothetical protein [Dehalococcoidia bacterium]